MQLGFDKAGCLAWRRHVHAAVLLTVGSSCRSAMERREGRAEIIAVLLFKK